ncbi:MAG: DUF1538 domain-containing protein [Clostridia bacterium]|nr:DUF1538 domain-containing protein [Clostridia bacterium]
MKNFKDKLKESCFSILPIAVIIMVLALICDLDAYSFVLFIIGAVLLIVGFAGFNLGADVSMLVLGEKTGKSLTHSRKVWLIALVSFVIGIIVTIAEPDLSILAGYVTEISSGILIITVAVGVGIFLMFAMLRIVFKIRLSIILIILYVAIFVVAFVFVDPSFWALSFDAGGVTTGPMTVPFIMSLGIGVASIRSDKGGKDDSFGLVALSSAGPVLAVLILGIIYNVQDLPYDVAQIETVSSPNLYAVCTEFGKGFLTYFEEVAISVSPIVIFFILFELITRAFHRRQVLNITVGIIIMYLGLVFFLTGANVGFARMGTEMGKMLGDFAGGWLLIPVAMLIGYFMVSAEPAVHVLNKQVERMTSGAVKARTMRTALSVSVCIALGLAMLRVITGINIMWFLVPGYAAALVLTFFSPKMFTGIAFDSGGVASGAMVSAFVLPMAIGACSEIAAEGATMAIMTDAFGCVAFVAMMPLIVIQVFGIIYKRRTAKIHRSFISVEDKIVRYEVD